MIHSLQFTDPALSGKPEARQWLDAVNARLLREQLRLVAELTAYGSAVMSTDYDDHLLRRKKPQPNPKPRVT